tara:strand:+ start:1239 stop:1412 length:174 start_codon:yes stop_codon:yes gene_type:complete
MTYKTIKWVLRYHIKNNVKSLWTWKDNEFKYIYKAYSSNAQIYTPQQLLNKIEKINK